MTKSYISTDSAPSAIGSYSQAVRTGQTVYLSGQIGIDPKTQNLVEGIDAQIEQVFLNLTAVAKATGGSLDDIVKLSVYLVDLTHFPKVNEAMSRHFQKPYPARAAVGVTELPKGALVEADAVLWLA
ncbi:MAG: Rid family detoxifying hydrolase [Zoogloeaceae bacterium]|jgi:reactive intermediate/imine deaminase|nr:Rid family detoxifying hydrolase [Zoogloeaceae bacterium]